MLLLLDSRRQTMKKVLLSLIVFATLAGVVMPAHAYGYGKHHRRHHHHRR
jgi:hypothetical protein